MASMASQLIEEVTAHAQSDSLEDVREICADGTYFPNNLRTSMCRVSVSFRRIAFNVADMLIVRVFYECGVVFVYILARATFLSRVSFLEMNSTGIVKMNTPGPCFTPHLRSRKSGRKLKGRKSGWYSHQK